MTPPSNVANRRAATSSARSSLAVATLAVASLALAACGSDSSTPSPSLTSVAPQSHAPTSTTDSSQSAPSGSSTSSGSSNSSSAPSTSTTRRPGVPSVAYPGAGGPAPAGASAATSEFYVTKSGNTHCHFWAATSSSPESVSCFSWGLTQGEHQNDTPLGGISNAVVDADGKTQAAPQSEAPPYMQENAAETTLEYDKPITKGSFVCAGNGDGTTCWETKTGHGFFISKTELQRF